MIEVTFLIMLNPAIAWHGTTLADICRLIPNVARLIVVPTVFTDNALSLVRLAADRFPGEVVPGFLMSFDEGNFLKRFGRFRLANWVHDLAAAARNERRLYIDFEFARNRLRKDRNRFTAKAFARRLPRGFEEILAYPSPLTRKTHDEGFWFDFLEEAAALRPELKLVDLSHNGPDVWNQHRRRYRADSLKIVGQDHSRILPLLHFAMSPTRRYWWYPQLEWGTRYVATELGHFQQMVFCVEDERLEEAAVWVDGLAKSLKTS